MTQFGPVQKRLQEPGLANKMAKYKLVESDLVMENGHAYAELTKLGLKTSGRACLDCGLMRPASGNGKACAGPVRVALRGEKHD